MKNNSDRPEDMLWDYLDGKLSPAQQEAFNQKLRMSAELRQRLEALKSAELALRTTKLETPSPNFTSRVMSRLDRYATEGPLSMGSSLLLLGGILVTATIAVLLLSAGYFDGATILDVRNLSIASEYIPKNLPGISVDGETIVNAIVLLSLAMAFVLLDRAILRPWFSRRMQTP